MEQSYIMIKPGFLHLESEIVKRINNIGGKIIKRKQFMLNSEVLKEHYSHLLELPFYPNIEKYMLSGEVVGMVVEGEDIINKIREILGPTKNAPKGTIRGDYATGVTENVLHASDGPETAKAEIIRFFG